MALPNGALETRLKSIEVQAWLDPEGVAVSIAVSIAVFVATGVAVARPTDAPGDAVGSGLLGAWIAASRRLAQIIAAANATTAPTMRASCLLDESLWNRVEPAIRVPLA